MIAARPSRAVAAWALFLGPAVLAWTPLRQAIDGRMVLQMTLLFPALLASGWAGAGLGGDRLPLARAFDRIDAGGLLGATLVICVSAFWMLPAALDLGLLSDGVQLGKFASWWIAGAALRRSWTRLANEPLAFFAGNLSWMLATAGLVYQESDARLCVNYLIDDQWLAGRALVLAAIALGALALARLVRRESASETLT
jgi:hypothetical protein